MRADGSGAHKIVGPIGAGHVHGLAWSAAGDRIALLIDGPSGGLYSFAADGSDFAPAGDRTEFCWPGRWC